jgi:hypothetical protein
MEPAADAVPIKILNDPKPVVPRSLLDSSTQIAESSAWLSGLHGIALSMLCRLEQS